MSRGETGRRRRRDRSWPATLCRVAERATHAASGEAGDHLSDERALLNRSGGDAGDEGAVALLDGRQVADDEDVIVTGDGEIGLHRNAAGAYAVRVVKV